MIDIIGAGGIKAHTNDFVRYQTDANDIRQAFVTTGRLPALLYQTQEVRISLSEENRIACYKKMDAIFNDASDIIQRISFPNDPGTSGQRSFFSDDVEDESHYSVARTIHLSVLVLVDYIVASARLFAPSNFGAIPGQWRAITWGESKHVEVRMLNAG